MPRWVAALIVAVVAFLLRWLLAPELPGEAGGLFAVLCLIVGIVALIAAGVLLILWLTGRGRGATRV